MSIHPQQRSRCHRLVAPSSAALALVLTGCFGGQTGGEGMGGGGGRTLVTAEDTGAPACADHVEQLAFDEPSGLSFTGADVLALAGGTHAASLLWNANSAPATYGPEQAESSIEMTVLYSGGEVRFVHTEVATPTQMGASVGGRGGAANAGATTDLAAPDCLPDRLEIDVVVRLNTGGGALAEEFDGILVANSPTVAQLVKELPLETLSGTFAVSVPEGYSTRSLKVDASIYTDSFHGVLWGQVDVPQPISRDPATSTKSGPLEIQYAQWPAPNPGSTR